MSKFLRVELQVPLSDDQAVLFEEVKVDFTGPEWNELVRDAIRYSALKETIIITDTEVVSDDFGFVMPENLPSFEDVLDEQRWNNEGGAPK